MAEGLILPYLDIPFQHASPSVLRTMRRPANEAKVLERLRNWRSIAPRHHDPLDLRGRLPRRDRRGLPVPPGLAGRGAARPRRRVPLRAVEGAAANDLPGAVPEAVKEERYARIMEKTAAITPRNSRPRSAARSK
ncbi:ribosomal protein S12 methylthiotransferase RimO [Ditylenchus destructor]|uniref:Ribosomal protein S12 methylthiotransferase RimO n=1 Tax=Ditylenchus destructor TaxID=166010 RepID=A0AAD4QUV3_9BILA|nr:ribosomal protein S12 methylthiotransferase RimO [Ditylenchus destructor]